MTSGLQLNQVHHQPNTDHINELDSLQESAKIAVPMGIANSKSTITSATKKDCCDYIIPPKRQPNCWRRLTPCQKTTICCGSVITAESVIIGSLIGTNTISLSGGAGVGLIIIAICCTIKITIGGLACYAKFSSQDKVGNSP